MKRLRVIGLWVFGVVCTLLLVGVFGGKAYLSGEGGRTQVAAQLSDTLGIPVEVDQLDVGFGSTTAGIRILDSGAGENESLLRIGKLDTDLSIGGFVSGKSTPTRIHASDVELLLRIDENGQLLSPMPAPKSTGESAPLPELSVSDVTVRIRQTGRPEFSLSGVSVSLTREGDGYAIHGEADDPNWGKWTLDGRLAEDPLDGRIDIRTDRGPLSEPLIRTIPYVPTVVWDHLMASGETPASLSFAFKPGEDIQYAVELNPTGEAVLTAPDVDVILTRVRGRILIAYGRVSVTNGSVGVANGNIELNGEYRFDQPTAEISAQVKASKLDIQKLPAKWGLPKELEGQLKGTANLELRIPPNGKLETLGSGEGEVDNAKLAGLPAEITMKLVADDGGYRFNSTSPEE